MRRTTLATLAAMCVLLVALTGCGGDPKPKHAESALPTPTHSASATPTPTDPVPPVMPAAAKKHTVAGAKSFVRYFWRVATYSQATLDPAPLRSLLSQGCPGCQGALGFIDDVSKARGTVHGGVCTPSNMQTTRLRAGDIQIVQVGYKLTCTRQVVDYPGRRKSDIYKAGTVTDQFKLSAERSGWQVFSWTVQ